MTDLEREVFKLKAAREVENVMNKYEYMLSHCQLEYALNLFALDQQDVRMELPFGMWKGPEGLRRCILNFHGSLYLGADGKPRPGAMYYNANAQSIIEVADDLKTAKGLWIAPGESADQGPDGEWFENVGTAVRACDFLYNEHEKKWKMWHYRVSGWTNNSFYKACVDDTSEPQSAENIPFTEETKPDGPTSYFWQYSRDRAVNYYPYIPEPYTTFSETFSY